MKKTKTVNFLKSGILLFGIFLLLWSCEKEANSNNLLPDKKIETVNIDEALDFLNINTDLVSKKSGFNRPYVVPDTKLISQENLVESDQLMTVIPATTVYKELYSRILLLKINDKIKSVVFSMYRNKDVKTENFSGEIIITDLKGGFLNGYRVDNGNIVTRFKRKEEKNKASLLFIGNSIAALFQDPVVCPDHGPCYEGSSCIMCNQNLDEVIVTGSSGSTSSGISVTDIYIDDSPDFTDEEETVSWIADDGAGGGGGFDCPYGQTKDENGNCVEAIIFNTDDLTNAQKEKLKEAIKKLKENCLGAALLAATNRVNIAMGATVGAGQYHPDTNTIKFRSNDDIFSGTLGAELFHAYQQQLYGTLSDIYNGTKTNGGSNMEFEEKAFNIMTDILAEVSVGEQGFGIQLISYPEEAELLYEWLTELQFNHPTEPINLNQSELDGWFNALEVFQQFHQGSSDHYGDPIDYNQNPNAILNLINRALEADCN